MEKHKIANSSIFKMNTFMKKIALFSAVALLSLASCSVLDNKPETEFSRDNYFTSEKNVELYAQKFYNEFSGYGNGGTYGNFYFNTLNDDQADRGITPWTYTSVSATNSVWNNAYASIREANILIAEIPNVDAMTEEAKDHWMAVARLYRGYQHFKLVRAFGDCYWVGQEIDETNGDIVYGKRMDRDLVMDNVLEDMVYAVEHIRATTSRTEFNKAVALAMLSEVALYEGTFCKYRVAADGQKAPDAARAQKWLETCVNASDAIIRGHRGGAEYALNDDFKANFNSLDLAGNQEMILYKHYVYGVLAHATIDYTCGSTPVKGMTKDAFDAYLGVDGKPCAAGTDKGVVKTIYAADGKCDLDHDVVDITDVLAARDPRLSAHVDNIVHFVDHGYARFGGAESTSTTGYGVFLFDNEEIPTVDRQSIGTNATDAPIYWLSYIMLNYAEAQAELGKTTEAKAAIDAIRAAHANMPSVDVTIAAAGTTVLEEVRRERRVEMMYCQNDRYWSLIRWHELDKLDTQKNADITLGAYACGLDGVAVNGEGYIDTKNGGMERVFDNKYYLFPIPTNEIALNPEIGQNYGW